MIISRLSWRRVRRAPRSNTQVHTLALRAEEAQDLHRPIAGASEPMRRAGVELRGLARLHHQIVLGDHETQTPAQHLQPLVALMGARVVDQKAADDLVERDLVGACDREQQLQCRAPQPCLEA